MRSAVVVRKLHKWLALIVGVQALIWTLTGLYMTAVHIDVIHGDHFIRTPAPTPVDPAILASPGPLIEATPGATALRLVRLLDKPVYVIEGSGRPALFDARSGDRLPPPSENAISQAALERYTGDGEIAKIELLDEVPAEIRGRPAPVWRVEFDHWSQPTLYLSPHTGELLTRRHELWRVFDFAWMLHIMDYETREDINNPILRIATIAAFSMALTGAALLIWNLPKRRSGKAKPIAMPRMSPLFFRRVHKWVGLVLGLQFVLWAASGAGMSILDQDQVMGHGAEHKAHTQKLGSGVVPPATLTAALAGVPVSGLALRPLHDRIVYEATTSSGIRLIDARTGREFTVDAPLARAIAEHELGSGRVNRVSRVVEPTLETRGHDGPSWRVDFADADGMSVYVSEATGRVIERRTDTWRLFDILWMLHTMDYFGRDDFNHPLIVVVAFGVLWLAGTGVYLIFKSFKRSEFRWLAFRGSRRRQTGRAPQG